MAGITWICIFLNYLVAESSFMSNHECHGFHFHISRLGRGLLRVGLTLLAVPMYAQSIGSMDGSLRASFTTVSSGRGLAVMGAGLASVIQPQPVMIELFDVVNGSRAHLSASYSTITPGPNGAIAAHAMLRGPNGSAFVVTDTWTAAHDVLHLDRSIVVHGSSKQGFLSSITLSHSQETTRAQVEYFAPGMIYSSPAHLTASAIGGADAYGPAGHGIVHVREDRLPAPLFGVRFPDGSSLTLMDPTPDGATTKADSHDQSIKTMVDEHFHFGSIGVDLDNGHQTQGFWFPGTEGETTYSGGTYPGGQEHRWRRRYHPIQEGLTQHYTLAFRFAHADNFPTFMRDTWRWAYTLLKPQIQWQDFAAIQRGVTDVIAVNAIVRGDSAFEPNAVSSVLASDTISNKACLGFTGKQFESAEMLLADSYHDSNSSRAAKDREIALELYRPFLATSVAPPAGECIDIRTGLMETPLSREDVKKSYLRSYTDDIKSLLRSYRREKQAGYDHPKWLLWARTYADWLLTQEHADGSFPRAWAPGTGHVLDDSPASTYNPIPLLVLLEELTGDQKYLDAAVRAGNFSWSHNQIDGQFIGGTIDNPDVLDKEAGTLSIEAYLALLDATHDRVWLKRAEGAADYAETYIYLWNVPMPPDEEDYSPKTRGPGGAQPLTVDATTLGWKPGVPTVGTQLIATGHSLTDDYMAFDVDEFARLWKETSDSHYREISDLLLHDTKNMIATASRPYDLRGPGWQQEHWSFAPKRGFGLHRLWLPWVATSQLEGMIGLQELDPALYKSMAEEGIP